jgi:hypothetical protein
MNNNDDFLSKDPGEHNPYEA